MKEKTTIESSFARLGATVSGRLHKFVMFFVRLKLSLGSKKVISHISGHKVWFSWLSYKWRYCDTNKVSPESRPCIRCEKSEIEGHDACLANLPGVKNACCGHGVADGYIQFMDGRTVRGQFNVE